MNEQAHQSQMQWYCYVNGEKQGPMSLYQIETLVFGNIVGRDTLVWNAALPNWVRLDDSSLRSLLDRTFNATPEIPDPAESMVSYVDRPPRAAFTPRARDIAGAYAYRAESYESLTLWAYFVRCITRQYAGFHGRARRKEYWGYTLFVLVFFGLGGAVVGWAAASGNKAFASGVVIALLVAGVANVVPGIAAGVRRLHDVGASGWLMLISLIPYVGSLGLVIIFLLPSQSQDNRHGPVPAGVRP